MNTLAIIAIVIVALLAALVLFASTRPNSFEVRRTANIRAPADRIFPLLNDFQRWGAWSPYEKKDPAMRRTFSGAVTGKGAVYTFEGNGQVGAGRLEITEVSPPTKVALTLDMIKPMKGHNEIVFTLEPTGDATMVTWAMRGSSPFLAKVMHLFFNMDRMIGRDFETGLANLKANAEG
jgi:uncharacterized protein YndB with AHSA1/START domain